MTRGQTIVALGIACVLATAGCDRLAKLKRGTASEADAGASSTPLSAPPTPQIRELDITFRETKARVSLFLHGTSYDISFFDFPPSAKVSVGNNALTTDTTGFITAKVDLSDAIARLAPQDAFNPAFKLDPKTKLALSFGPQANLLLDAPPITTSRALIELFQKASVTPFSVGAPPKPGAHTVILIGPVTPDVLGVAKTVADIDWVALIEKQPARSGKTCSGYRRSGDPQGVASSLGLKLLVEKLSVFEVRTGKPVADKVFTAPNDCPQGGIGELKSYVSVDEQKRWLKQLTATRR